VGTAKVVAAVVEMVNAVPVNARLKVQRSGLKISIPTGWEVDRKNKSPPVGEGRVQWLV